MLSEIDLIHNNSEIWRAIEMPPEHFNPYDIELPDVPTFKFHGTVNVGDSPIDWSFETQEHLVDNTREIFPLFSGFGAIKDSSAPFSNAMAQLEMGTLTIEQVRNDGRSIRERLYDPHKIQIEAMGVALEALQYETGIQISNDIDGTKLVPIGHSMGGEPALRYAEGHHEAILSVILFATIGYGSPNVLTILSKIPRGIVPAIKEEFVPFLRCPEMPKELRIVAKALGYFGVNPVRTIGEAGSCLTSKQGERTTKLRNSGIPIIYGQPVYDLLVQGMEGAKESVSTVSEIPRSGHMILQAKPCRAAHWVMSVMNTTELSEAA